MDNKELFDKLSQHLGKKVDEINKNLDDLIDWKNEMEKCKASPFYFFTNYCMVNGEKATTNLSEEEFNSFMEDGYTWLPERVVYSKPTDQ